MYYVDNDRLLNSPITWVLIGIFPVGSMYSNFTNLVLIVNLPDILVTRFMPVNLLLQLCVATVLFFIAYRLFSKLFSNVKIREWGVDTQMASKRILLKIFFLLVLFKLVNQTEFADVLYLSVRWLLDVSFRSGAISYIDSLIPIERNVGGEILKNGLVTTIRLILAVYGIRYIKLWFSAISACITELSVFRKGEERVTSGVLGANSEENGKWKDVKREKPFSFSHLMAILLLLGVFSSVITGILNLSGIYLQSYSSEVRRMASAIVNDDAFIVSTRNIVDNDLAKNITQAKSIALKLSEDTEGAVVVSVRDISSLLDIVSELRLSVARNPKNDGELKGIYQSLQKSVKELEEAVNKKPDDDWEILVLRSGVVLFFVFLSSVFVKLFMSIRRSLEREEQHYKAIEVIANITQGDEFERYYKVATAPIQVSKEGSEVSSEDTLKLVQDILKSARGK